MIGILGGNYSYYWSGVASSADGTKLVATAYGQVDVINSGVMFVSTNSGVDWTQANTTFDVCWSVAIANDGSELIAGAMDDPVYISTDSGTTWLASGSTNELFWSVAASADGSHIVASTFLWGQIFTSANHGETWTVANAPNAAWQAIASSADGSKLVAVIDGGQIYASVDFGKTWTPTDAPSTNWISVASSADGNRFVAAVKGGGIWVSQLNSSPQLNLTTSSNVIVLSWTVPSTNFVLQESTDLISWTDETNPPVLDLTNLQNQITLFPSNASGFFRLKTL
jgi:photosystem II stability/assembly factor-like uncharacterized protein